MMSGTMSGEQYRWLQVLVSHLKWRAQEKPGCAVDVCRIDCGSSERGPAVSSVPIMTGQHDFGGCGCVFSWGEWSLLNEAQRRQYHDMMLQVFALISSLGKACTITHCDLG